MSAIARGAKNALRNPGRAMAVVVILGLSLALALSMAVARQAVDERIASAKGNVDSVLASLGNTLLVRPAGAGGFGGGGGIQVGRGGDAQQATLDQGNLTALSGLAHVASVTEALTVQVPTAQTSLKSAVNFTGRGGGGRGGGGGGTFTLPITAIGANDLAGLSNLGTGSFTVASGSAPGLMGSASEALVGQELATKNGLIVGSTFTLYGATVSVSGIAETSTANRFSANSLVLPLATLQGLANRTGEVSTAIVRVDSVANMATTQAAVASALGSSADVINLQEQASQSNAVANADSTLASLANVSGIALTSLIGALVASAVIVLLTMYMVVRERRREIGVLKALGSSNGKVVAQYTTEAVVLTGLSLVLGFALAVLFGNTVTHALVASNASGAGGGGGPGGGVFGGGGGLFGVSTQNINASLDPALVLLGLGVAFIVAILGSAVPAFAVAKVRPSEVLRGE